MKTGFITYKTTYWKYYLQSYKHPKIITVKSAALRGELRMEYSKRTFKPYSYFAYNSND